MNLIGIFLSVLWDATSAAFAAQPLMFSALVGAVIAVTLSCWDGLERKGLRCVAWAIAAAALFGLAAAAGKAAQAPQASAALTMERTP